MITCPNCAHHNPEGATQCEACYTPLPELIACPGCGAKVAISANFCGQCGYALQSQTPAQQGASPIQVGSDSLGSNSLGSDSASQPTIAPQSFLQAVSPVAATQNLSSETGASSPAAPQPTPALQPQSVQSVQSGETPTASILTHANSPGQSVTRLQQFSARLIHLQSGTPVELPSHLPLLHLGKPNSRIPPDIDISGFADSDIVSRVHADIRIEGDRYYLEDIGSTNGTYVNNLPLRPGNRHQLRPGDRISLGKGDKVSFLFQLS